MNERDQAGPANPAAAYQRISLDKTGDEHGVNNQLADQERAAAARGYTIVISESDNDISALTGQHRPGYERVMAAAARGDINAIFIFQTSRFWRNRRERAEGIEILRKAGVSLIATKGPSLDMSNAYGRAMAGLLGEFDTMESEVKAERQQLANSEAARNGQARRGTSRPFGWRPDYITADPAEKAAVEDACRVTLAGGSLAGIIRDWERRGLRPHRAPFGPLPRHPWTSRAVKKILTNPRNAGISVYRGSEVGPGEWEPLVSEPTFRAVVQVLGDPRRVMSKGVTSLLGGLAFCRCGNYVTGSRNNKGVAIYRCNDSTRDGRTGPHVHVQRTPVDEAVGALVAGRMSMEDAIDLLVPQVQGDTAALKDEAQAIHTRMLSLPRLFMRGVLSEDEVAAAKADGARRLAEIEADLAEFGRESVLAQFFDGRRAAAVWAELTDDQRRPVIRALMTVTLYPPGRGAREFRPEIVMPPPPGNGIVWKQPGTAIR